jgi:hypothetical protein
MVRRGSTVRVRQRALQKPRVTALFRIDLQVLERGAGMEPFMEPSGRKRPPRARCARRLPARREPQAPDHGALGRARRPTATRRTGPAPGGAPVRDQFKRPCTQAATASLGAGDRQRTEYADLRPIRYCDHVWRWRGELDRRRLLGRGDVDVRQRGRGTLGREDYERRRVQSRRACAQGRQAGRAASSGLRSHARAHKPPRSNCVRAASASRC